MSKWLAQHHVYIQGAGTGCLLGSFLWAEGGWKFFLLMCLIGAIVFDISTGNI